MTPINEIRSGDFVEYNGYPFHVGIRRVVKGEVQLGLNRIHVRTAAEAATMFVKSPARVKLIAKWPQFPKDYRR